MRSIFKPRPILGLLIVLILAGAVRSQCVATPSDPCVNIHQSILDRSAKMLDELTEARKVIDAFKNERSATDAERAAWVQYKALTDQAFTVLQKGLTDREAVIALQDKALRLYSELVDKLTAQINKPKSGWSKFLGAVEKVVVLLAGVAIGRAGL